MRCKILSVLIFVTIASHAQQIDFYLYRKDFCKDTSELSLGYLMWKNPLEKYSPDGLTGKCTLPDTGTYFISTEQWVGYEPGAPFHQVTIREHSERRDTIPREKIQLYFYHTDPPTVEYRICGELCNGYFTDYYPNGQIRLQATFKRGQPVDKFNLYSYDGKPKEESLYQSRNVFHTYFDTDGVITLEEKYRKIKSFPGDYLTQLKTYYPNGRLEENIKYNKARQVLQKRYSEQGQLLVLTKKKKKIIFYTSGHIHQKLKKRKAHWLDNYIENESYQRLFFWKKDKILFELWDYKFHYTERDENGNTLIRGTFEIFALEDKDYFTVSYQNADWFRLMKFYNAQEIMVKKVKNVKNEK